MALSFFLACSLTMFHLFIVHIPCGHLMLFVPCYYCICFLMLIFLLAINSMTYLFVCDTSLSTIITKTFPWLVVVLQGEQLVVATFNFHLLFLCSLCSSCHILNYYKYCFCCVHCVITFNCYKSLPLFLFNFFILIMILILSFLVVALQIFSSFIFLYG
jgi:hypothetical protein